MWCRARGAAHAAPAGTAAPGPHSIPLRLQLLELLLVVGAHLARAARASPAPPPRRPPRARSRRGSAPSRPAGRPPSSSSSRPTLTLRRTPATSTLAILFGLIDDLDDLPRDRQAHARCSHHSRANNCERGKPGHQPTPSWCVARSRRHRLAPGREPVDDKKGAVSCSSKTEGVDPGLVVALLAAAAGDAGVHCAPDLICSTPTGPAEELMSAARIVAQSSVIGEVGQAAVGPCDLAPGVDAAGEGLGPPPLERPGWRCRLRVGGEPPPSRRAGTCTSADGLAPDEMLVRTSGSARAFAATQACRARRHSTERVRLFAADSPDPGRAGAGPSLPPARRAARDHRPAAARGPPASCWELADRWGGWSRAGTPPLPLTHRLLGQPRRPSDCDLARPDAARRRASWRPAPPTNGTCTRKPRGRSCRR